ncbi:MAG: 2-oxoacid:ferredoxin oxidoreductase subunit beta [Anaerolineae bacterium]
MSTVKDYSNDIRPTWCSGCGDFGIWNALKRAFVEAKLEPQQIMMVTGIGCGSKMPDYMRIPAINSLHGRTLAVATGYKLANHAMKVVCVHGDGDGYGMGANHFLQTIRRNVGLLDIIEDNHVYGLTKGQYSPTSRKGWVTKTSPDGAIERPLNPLALAISQGATFVARGFALDIAQLAKLIVAGLNHRGYALIDVMQPCVSFNRPMSYAWYRERVYQVADTAHDPTNRDAALAIAFQYPGNGDKIPLGVIYQDESVPAYEERVVTLEAGTLSAQPFRTRPAGDYHQLIEELL